jgi:predicted RNase H-like HicB family nuclease
MAESVYVAVILEDAHDEYSVHFPDVPGCFTRGATIDQACRFAAETLAFHLERFAARHLAPPLTRSLDALRAEPEHRGATFVLVAPTALALWSGAAPNTEEIPCRSYC